MPGPIEGNADADHDGKVTLKELFANIRQVVYQLSDQRQNVVTMTSPSRSPDIDVAFGLTRGVTLIQGPIEGRSVGTRIADIRAAVILSAGVDRRSHRRRLRALLPVASRRSHRRARTRRSLRTAKSRRSGWRRLTARPTTFPA